MLRKSARVLIGIAIAEFALLAFIVSQFGVPLSLVVALVVGGSAVGLLLSMRQVGQLVGSARRTGTSGPTGAGTVGNSAAAAGAELASSVSDGAMRAVAGLLLAFPGLLTGLVGTLLLVPPVRRSLKPRLWGWFTRLVPVELRNVGAAGQPFGAAGQPFGAGASFQDLFGRRPGSNPFGPGPGVRRPRRDNVVDVDVASTEPDSSGNPSSAPPELR